MNQDIRTGEYSGSGRCSDMTSRLLELEDIPSLRSSHVVPGFYCLSDLLVRLEAYSDNQVISVKGIGKMGANMHEMILDYFSVFGTVLEVLYLPFRQKSLNLSVRPCSVAFVVLSSNEEVDALFSPRSPPKGLEVCGTSPIPCLLTDSRSPWNPPTPSTGPVSVSPHGLDECYHKICGHDVVIKRFKATSPSPI